MSRRWEIAIQDWYTKAPTAKLEYLDLANSKPTTKELAHNLAVIFDRLSLSNRVNLKNFKQIQEEVKLLKEENCKLVKEIKNLTKEVIQDRSVTEKQLEKIIAQITEKHKQETRQSTSSYKEALQATEAIEAPALGFCRPADHKGAISGTIASIKQLLVTILEKLENLEDRIRRIEEKTRVSQEKKQVKDKGSC
ncbi:hypothetical protein ZIOFF_038803 [Zingiber officinale]|uniref:Uncharacterized protein n=1 Tax=Zingiber officinale TaxID=94328 RepID=A0A8J5KZQ4_ZINOF|nr:hypothetical protein ZIOFF_038803 [Zingiber officinale]